MSIEILQRQPGSVCAFCVECVQKKATMEMCALGLIAHTFLFMFYIFASLHMIIKCLFLKVFLCLLVCLFVDNFQCKTNNYPSLFSQCTSVGCHSDSSQSYQLR